MKKNIIITILLILGFMLLKTNQVNAAESDFVIKDNYGDKELIKYKGHSSVVRIPKGVKIISSDAFKNKKKIKKIVLSKTVEEIYDRSFYNLKNLKEIDLSNVECIEKGAFVKCPKVKEIIIPKKCYCIGEWALSGLTGLKKIKVEKGNKNYKSINGVLFSKNKDSIICYPRKKKTKKHMLYHVV